MSVKSAIAGKGALILMTIWAAVLIISWLIVLGRLLEGGMFYGT